MNALETRLQAVNTIIDQAAEQAGRPRQQIQLLAVSKTKPASHIRAAYDLGQRAFGENYVQEACDKKTELADLDIDWHFIGPLQSNKTRAIAEAFNWVHSVDRLKIAQRLNDQRPANLPSLNICLQLNIDEEDSKSGFLLNELSEAAAKIATLENLTLRGLMVIPRARDDYTGQLTVFQQVQSVFLDLQKHYPQMDTLSMGMSGDIQAAIAAGSTIVRVGSAIFGARA